ncbi:MAG: cyclopropane fatty acyl phospholipid synthase, partial [Desulfovibrionaceae bacterium]|nr:cyclopropane fatty acyl phospholipid synthase [Desulfovibrionaceae bacterium]
DVRVHNDGLLERLAREGTLGAGEAYMEGWWDCDELDTMFCKAILGKMEREFAHSLPAIFVGMRQKVFNMQDRRHARDVAKRHYNMDNDLFAAMLGPTMNYSCGYWRHADNLDDAQYAKMDLICRKLELRPGMTVLDIGCGWGGLARFMTERYGAKVTGVSVASEQIRYAKEHDPEGKVSWVCDDYRSMSGQYDRVVSVGMFEHVGRKNYAVYMRKALDLLKSDGLFLLHTIGANYQKSGVDPWINKYIFPNGMLPSPMTLTRSFSGLFVLEDWQNFGSDYDKTLMAWYRNFEKGITEGGFRCDEYVRRMYRYYLLSCAGCFRARDIQLWQLILSPRGVVGGYNSVR